MSRSKSTVMPRRKIPGFIDLKADLDFCEFVAKESLAGNLTYLDALHLICKTVVSRKPQRIADWVRKNLRAPAGKTGRNGTVVLSKMQAAIADLFQREDIKQVTYLKGPRIGASFLIAALMLYFACYENKPVMFYDRALKNARTFYDEKFMAILQESDAVRHLLPEERSSVDRQRWTDRTLTTGAGVRFRSVSDKIKSDMAVKLFADEAGDSAYMNKGKNSEGSKAGLLRARVQEHSESTCFFGGTPTRKGECTVSDEWERSNKCEWYMDFSAACCGHKGPFVTDVRQVKEKGVRYGPGIRYTVDAKGNCDDAWHECSACGAEIPKSMKVDLLETGWWEPTAEDTAQPGHWGVRSWMANSQDPNATWIHIGDAHLLAMTQPEKAQDFVNLWLAQPWVPPISKSLDVSDLREHEVFVEGGKIPRHIKYLFAGIDAQRGVDLDPDKPSRMEMVVYGVGDNLRRHVVAHHVIAWQEIADAATGEILKVPIPPYSWTAGEHIGAILDTWYETEDGRQLRIVRAACDVGYEMEQATAFVRTLNTGHRRVVPVRGSSDTSGNAPAIGKDREARSFLFKNGILVQKLGTRQLKEHIRDTMAVPLPGPQSWTFAAGFPDAFYEDLLVEHLVEMPSGRTVWKLKDKARRTGEVADCLNYGLAAELMERDWTEHGQNVMIPDIRIEPRAYDDALLAAAEKIRAEVAAKLPSAPKVAESTETSAQPPAEDAAEASDADETDTALSILKARPKGAPRLPMPKDDDEDEDDDLYAVAGSYR